MACRWSRCGAFAAAHALDGGRARRPVVVRGPAGVGKTRLMPDVLDRLAGRGASLVHVVGSTADAEIPFGAVAHLLPDDVADGDQLAMLRGAMQTLEATGSPEQGTHVLAVDDAQWLDNGSAAVVHRAATVAARQLVGTVRDGAGAPDVITRLASDAATLSIELEPLTEDQVATLLEAVLAGPVVRSSARRLARLREGNPLWLRELVRDARRRGALTRVGGSWRLDGSPVRPPWVALRGGPRDHGRVRRRSA